MFQPMRRIKHRGRKTTRIQFAHTKRRAAERFGVALTKPAYYQIIQDIQKGRAVFLQRQSNSVSIWQVTVEGELMVAFYDKRRKAIKTVITPDQYERELC